MKKLINFILIAIACLAVACHKDAVLTKLAAYSIYFILNSFSAKTGYTYSSVC